MDINKKFLKPNTNLTFRSCIQKFLLPKYNRTISVYWVSIITTSYKKCTQKEAHFLGSREKFKILENQEKKQNTNIR